MSLTGSVHVGRFSDSEYRGDLSAPELLRTSKFTDFQNFQHHIVADATIETYGCAAYFRTIVY